MLLLGHLITHMTPQRRGGKSISGDRGDNAITKKTREREKRRKNCPVPPSHTINSGTALRSYENFNEIYFDRTQAGMNSQSFTMYSFCADQKSKGVTTTGHYLK